MFKNPNIHIESSVQSFRLLSVYSFFLLSYFCPCVFNLLSLLYFYNLYLTLFCWQLRFIFISDSKHCFFLSSASWSWLDFAQFLFCVLYICALIFDYNCEDLEIISIRCLMEDICSFRGDARPLFRVFPVIWWGVSSSTVSSYSLYTVGLTAPLPGIQRSA
jgi:hypothetical protein